MSDGTQQPEPKRSPESWVVFISSYPPRECGIATYTKHLSQEIAKQMPKPMQAKIIAINPSKTKSYDYSRNVIREVAEGDREGFKETAEWLNRQTRVKLVVISHEFGLFGGKTGDALLPFLETIKKPVMTIFHTVLPRSHKQYGEPTERVIEHSDQIIVMNKTAMKLMSKEYNVLAKKIALIPHGIPTIPAYSKDEARKKIGLGDRLVLSSFGLLGPCKGYDVVLSGLPQVVREFPNVIYLILGQTHPKILQKQGEVYRHKLERLVRKLKLENNVRFYNHYLSQEDVVKYLKATNIYVCASQDPNQMVSGTLSYALGSGTATVSTPFMHARELAEDNVIMLANFVDPSSFAKAILALLKDPSKRQEYEERAFTTTRKMTWPNVAHAYYKRMLPYLGELADKQASQLPALRSVSLKHLMRLTDDFGVIQFAQRSVPDIESGYCVDDVSRALVALTTYWVIYRKPAILLTIRKYLDFIRYVQGKDGRFFNYVDKNKIINTEDWSRDAHARTVWALGYLMAAPGIPKTLKVRAETLFAASLPIAKHMDSLRSMSFSTIGLYFFFQYSHSPAAKKQLTAYAEALVKQFDAHAHGDWQWFEDRLTYSNSKLPETLFYAFTVTRNKRYLEVAETALDFLIRTTFVNEVFHPIGQDGWYERNGKRAHFDQQPVDTASMVRTLMVAYRVTDRLEYLEKAHVAYSWFLGNNALHLLLYNETTGGCHDGLGKEAVNQNQGAESTIVHLMARLCIDTRAKLL
ncbi:MAG: glycosyltransferase [Candidatus Kerfeldbacteria bacterium]